MENVMYYRKYVKYVWKFKL